MNSTRQVAERFTEVLESFIDSRLEEMDVDSENVIGLEHAIEKEVENQLENYEAGGRYTIQGLERFVENVVDGFEIKSDNISDLEDAVNGCIESFFDYLPNQEKLFASLLQTPAFQQALDRAVRESLCRLAQQLFTGLLPVAQPVVQPARFNNEGGMIQEPVGNPPITITPEMRAALGL